MRMNKTRALVAVAGALASIATASAQVSYTGTAITENFDNITASWTDNTTLPGWSLRRTNGNTVSSLLVNNGNTNNGAFYSWGGSGDPDRALGSIGSNSATGGYIYFGATNNTASTVTEVTVAYDGEQWRNGGNATAQNMTLEYGFGPSFSSVAWTAPGGNFNWTSVVNTASAATVDGNTAGKAANRGGTLTGINWNPGDTIWFRWTDLNDAGNDHGLAIDNFSLTGPVVVNDPSLAKTLVVTPSSLNTVPGDISYQITGISNNGGGTATTPSITATFPAGVSYNASASNIPAGATASFNAGVLTITLPSLAAAETFPDITVVFTATTEFPAPTGLAVTFTSAPGTDSDPTTVIVAATGPQAISFTGPDLTQNFDGINSSTNPFTATIGEQFGVPGVAGFAATKLSGSGATALPYLTSDGASNTGGLYNFGATSDTDRALGALASGSNVAGFGVAIVNNSGAPINSFTLTFDVEQYRSSTSVTNTLPFAYGLASEGVTLSDYISSFSLTSASQADVIGDPFVTTNGILTPPSVKQVVATIVPASPIAVGDTIFLRWQDTNDAGNDAGLAIDNFVFSTAVPANASVTQNVSVNSPTYGTVPADITYTFSSIANNTPINATGAQITATFPSNVSFVSSTFPNPADVSFSGGVLTVNLGNVAAGGTVPDFTVTVSATAEFPESSPLAVTFASTPGTDTDNTSVVVFNNTNTVIQDDLVVGLSQVNIANTLQLYRGGSTSALIPDAYNAAFIQSVEFDSLGGQKSNANGNLLGVNFGSTLPGGVIWAFPTQNLGAFSGNVIGSFTDATTFTHGSTTSSLPASRLSGVSVALDNSKIAVAGYDTGAIYVFDYANTGDGQATLSNGRAMNDGVNNSSSARTVGTTWLDATHVAVAQAVGTDVRVTVYEVTSTDVIFVSSLTLPVGGAGANFTDIEFNPNVPAPLNNKLIVSANSSDGGNPAVFSSTLWVIDAPVGPAFTFGAAPAGIDYSSSTPSFREIALGSNGDLYVQQIGGTVDRIAFNADLGTMFVANNGVNFRGFSGSFSGMDIAAGTGGGVVADPRCNPADIANDDGSPLSPNGPAGGTNNGVTEGDYNLFFARFFDSDIAVDIANDDGSPLPPFGPLATNNGVTEGDYNLFFSIFFDGCAF